MCRVVAGMGITTQSYTTLHCTTLHYTALHFTTQTYTALLVVLHSISGSDGDQQSYTIYYQLYINCSCSTMPQNNPTLSTILHIYTSAHLTQLCCRTILRYPILHNYRPAHHRVCTILQQYSSTLLSFTITALPPSIFNSSADTRVLHTIVHNYGSPHRTQLSYTLKNNPLHQSAIHPALSYTPITIL